MKATPFLLLSAALTMIACGDRQQAAQADSEQAPAGEVIDTAQQRRDFTPQTGLPDNPKAPVATVGDGTVGDKVTVEIKDKKLTLSQMVMAPGPVTFSFNNTDSERHIIEIRFVPGGRWRSVPVGKGGSVVMAQSLNVGDYEIYCFVPGHKEKGETASFVVR